MLRLVPYVANFLSCHRLIAASSMIVCATIRCGCSINTIFMRIFTRYKPQCVLTVNGICLFLYFPKLAARVFQRFLQFIGSLIVLWVAFDVYVITIITLFIKTILQRSVEGFECFFAVCILS